MKTYVLEKESDYFMVYTRGMKEVGIVKPVKNGWLASTKEKSGKGKTAEEAFKSLCKKEDRVITRSGYTPNLKSWYNNL